MMRIYLILALLAMSPSVLADESKQAATQAEIPAAVTDAAKFILKEQAFKITPSPIDGFYEVVIDGKDILYLTQDGVHLVSGKIFEVKTQDNLTKKRHDELLEAFKPKRKQMIEGVSESDMVVFAPKTETKYTLNVFTDVDCGYCAKIHQDVLELNKKGVKVRYLAFPRAGIGSETYKKMVSVWCADNQQQAMTDAKARREIKEVTCDNPIAAQYKLAQKLGIRGTPTMVLSNGELVVGYFAIDKLMPRLEEAEKN